MSPSPPSAADAARLRARHRRARAALDAATQAANSEAVCTRVRALPSWDEAQRVAVYIAVRGELSLQPLFAAAAADGKQLLLPVLLEGEMHFAPWSPERPLHQRAMGLLEPDAPPARWLAPAALDLVLAPLVAFDDRCQRLGQGGGYYDRAFAFKREQPQRAPLLFGVAHDSQREARLPAAPWDVPLDAVISEAALYRPHWRGGPGSDQGAPR